MKKQPMFKPNFATGTKKFNSREKIDAMYKSPIWVEYSKEFLKTNPKCYSCGSPSQATDHLTPHKGDVTLFEQNNNHIPLCHKCHNTVTALFDRKPVFNLQDKIKWLHNNRERNGISVKVFVLPYRRR